VKELLEDVVRGPASPGVPLAVFGNTNSRVLSLMEQHVIDTVTARLTLFSKRSAKAEGLSAVELVREGFCDPVRLFVKNEPHRKVKLLAGRQRLISSVSLIDQVVERVIGRLQNASELNCWDRIPSKVGLGLDDFGVRKLWTEVSNQSLHRRVGYSDMKGWDWSVQDWEFDLEVMARLVLNGSSLDSLYGRLLSNRMYCLSLSVFATSDGELIAQASRGVMKSGSYWTSSTNSRLRVMVAWMVGAEWVMAQGDDAVEHIVPDAKAKYYELGHNLKALDPVKDPLRVCGFEFCSTWMLWPGLGYPASWWKILYRLLHKSPGDAEALEEALGLLRHHPERESFEALLVRAGWSAQN
jgi:hypothetical protein